MRVLVVGPRFADSFADNVVCALEDMGHDVRAMADAAPGHYWSLPRYATRVLRERLFGDRPAPADVAALTEARRFAPQVILSPTWDIHPHILEQLSLGGTCRRVLWWGDAPANSQRWGLANPHWDTIYTKDPEAVPKLRLIGADAHLLHEAMNPRWHRPLASAKNDDVVLIGSFYGYRQAVALRLLESGVSLALYGPKPPTWAHSTIKSKWSGKFLQREDKSVALGEALGCLNTFQLSEGNSLNCRAFETAGAGALQFIANRPILADCFEPGREILPFETFEELLTLIDRARKHPEEMRVIREAGARRALAEHTYRHRLERILTDTAS
jgi:spore maturation protein CgeB